MTKVDPLVLGPVKCTSVPKLIDPTTDSTGTQMGSGGVVFKIKENFGLVNKKENLGKSWDLSGCSSLIS